MRLVRRPVGRLVERVVGRSFRPVAHCPPLCERASRVRGCLTVGTGMSTCSTGRRPPSVGLQVPDLLEALETEPTHRDRDPEGD